MSKVVGYDRHYTVAHWENFQRGAGNLHPQGHHPQGHSRWRVVGPALAAPDRDKPDGGRKHARQLISLSVVTFEPGQARRKVVS